MEILPIYSKEQEEKLKSADLDLSMVYLLDTSSGKKIPNEKWRRVNRKELGSLEPIVDFLQEVEETKLKIEPALYEVSKRLQNQIDDEYIGKIIDRAIRSPSWRERATIMNIIGKMYNAKFDNNLFKAAISVELMQEAFMLRDDILDEQERCVNRETIPKTYGRNAAELAKDILLSDSRNIMLETENPKIMQLLEEMILNDSLGQWMDIKSETDPFEENNSEEKYFKMITLTPGTQFKNIAAIAYILSGQTEIKQLIALQEWGLKFGMAAQLRDDIVDVIGDEQVVYKKLGTDILRKKMRLPLIKYLEINSKYKQFFTNAISRIRELKKILLDIQNSSAITCCENEVREFVNEALKYLTENFDNNRERQLLENMTYLLMNFNKSQTVRTKNN